MEKSSNDSKEFKGSMKRILKELKTYKKIIIISIIFATVGTFLSVIAPNGLSNLTDEIGKGLVVQHDNLNELIECTSEEITEDIEIDGILITKEEQKEFKEAIADEKDELTDLKLYSKIDDMPESIKKVVMPFMNMSKIKFMTLILVVIYVASSVCMYVQAETMAEVTNRFAKNLRSRVSLKINDLPLKYFDKHSSGDIISRTTNDIDTIAQSMNQSLENLLGSIILVIGTTIMMFVTNWIMGITAIAASLIGIILTGVILRKSQKYFLSRQKELGSLNNHIEEVYSNMKLIKAYNGKETALKEFERLNQKVYDSNQKSQFLSGLMQPIMDFVGNFGYVAVCIVGAILTMNNIISFGVIIAFITYVKLFTSPLVQIAQSTTFLQSTAAASHRVFEFLDARELTNEKDINKVLEKENVKGKIDFENVTFSYNSSKKKTINDFSLHIAPGEKVAIVGEIGAGKTTITSLLLKLYDVDSGNIKIDGISISELKRENIHKICTLVFQEPWIFDGTIKENIIYNREGVSDKRVKEVAKKIGLSDFIEKLPKKYNTKISYKDNISAGQKQLIAIARGLIEDAPILVLDEATSNVDIEIEEKLLEVIEETAKTIILISHKLSVIKKADVIVFVKNGKIIEKGTHDELVKLNGEYAKMFCV